MDTAGARVAAPTARLRVRVDGTVQGVGFRPFVYGLATRLGLGGLVGNDSQGVFIEVEGEPAVAAAFLDALSAQAPPLAAVERVASQPIPLTGQRDFVIVESAAAGPAAALVSPDMATCTDCRRELFDPTDRRFRYPFINCTNCGPRFTIVRGVPYDRPLTTMAGFPLCVDCRREYDDPRDRRFHAQPVCCPACGPRLGLVDAAGRPLVGDPVIAAAADGRAPDHGGPVPAATPDGNPVIAAAELLRAGQIVAIKGLGGYHLAVLASDQEAAARLRARKHREDRPFALMAPDLVWASRLCEAGQIEESLLTSPPAPIVVLPRRPDAAVAAAVAPGERSLGLMLPYTPLHHLLAAELAAPFVLTSGNVSDEPIAYRDDEALERLGGIADAFLTSDRPIVRRVDDSVVRVVRGAPVLVRRSRGYVPRPLELPWRFPRPVLACGGELKNTFCAAKEDRAFLSHHIGDLENYETLRSFTEGIGQFRDLFDVRPEVVVHDLHPEYLSTKYAVELDGVELVGVQHHHAHIAACLADNGVAGPVIGIAFDGLGFGVDGTMWGGEVLLADLCDYERLAHFEAVPMPGGAAAVREPWRMAAAYLDSVYDGGIPEGLDVVRRHAGRWGDIVSVARAGVNAPRTSSVGRLFDAVAALLGLRDAVSYEGQAAIELEQRADPDEAGRYDVGMTEGPPVRIAGTDLVRAVVGDAAAGVPVPVVAARFHNTLASVVVEVSELARDRTAISTVALSGGVFQNVLLLERAAGLLEAAGFEVLTHSRVPTNDGGLSLGQAAVAGARDRARSAS